MADRFDEMARAIAASALGPLAMGHTPIAVAIASALRDRHNAATREALEWVISQGRGGHLTYPLREAVERRLAELKKGT